MAKGHKMMIRDYAQLMISKKLKITCKSSLKEQANQAVIQDGRVDIQRKNVGYAGNGNKNAGRVRDAKYFKEQMLLATKDEDGVHLDEEENDFMLDNAYGDNALE
nr:hypothetical protein [Tanacetum cinerariifolium]